MSNFLFNNIVESIRKKSINELPGLVAHQLMAPMHRFPASYYLEREKEYRTACVLALLFPDPKTNLTRITLIERTGGNFVHANQISFPGGKIENDDASNEDAALRETFEEIGVPKAEIEILSKLSSLYIPPSKFLVHPFIGITLNVPEFILSKDEVVSVLTPYLSMFLDENNILNGEFSSARGNVVNAPYYFIEEKKIWGATAMMISELIAMTS